MLYGALPLRYRGRNLWTPKNLLKGIITEQWFYFSQWHSWELNLQPSDLVSCHLTIEPWCTFIANCLKPMV